MLKKKLVPKLSTIIITNFTKVSNLKIFEKFKKLQTLPTCIIITSRFQNRFLYNAMVYNVK